MANSSDYYHDKGLDFLKDENYEEALMYIDKAIEMDKDIPDYWISKSKCLSIVIIFSNTFLTNNSSNPSLNQVG